MPNNNCNFVHEIQLQKNGYKYIIGIDEAGRGPWAGPLSAGAVIINPQTNHQIEQIHNINDSKKLSAKQRNKIFAQLTNSPNIYWHYTEISNTEIDQHGLAHSAKKIFQKTALALIQKYNLPANSCYAIIDGKGWQNFTITTQKQKNIPFKFIINGDSQSITIASASIIAKVTRDKFMINSANKYSQYGFEKHKGYGTKYHRQQIETHGTCPLHRKSFKPIANILNKT